MAVGCQRVEQLVVPQMLATTPLPQTVSNVKPSILPTLLGEVCNTVLGSVDKPTVNTVKMGTLLYCIDGDGKIPSVNVYDKCLEGTCTCAHYVGGKSTQLKPCRFANFISGSGCNVFHENYIEAQFIWEGVVQGFKIVDDDCKTSYHCKNYDSILSGPFYGEMCELVSNELSDGLVTKVGTRPQCVHSLGGVPKSNGKLRPITDCSMPHSISINNHMKQTFKTFKYNSVNSVVELLKHNDYMSVIDLKSAFRTVNVYAPHTRFQGFAWNSGHGNEWFESNRLSFGLRCAPYIFDKLSNFIVKVAKGYGVSRVVNYLDDFIVIADSAEECLRQRNLVIEVMEYLGFEVSYKKVTDPARVTTYLGITINSVDMELTLPVEKLVKLNDHLDVCLRSRTVTKKLLQTVGGLMSFCSQIVRGGRTFSRRLFDLCAKTPSRGRIRLDIETIKDLEWWKQFCSIFNCRSLIQKDMSSIPIVSDSSKRGFGAWAGGDYFFGFWKDSDVFGDYCGHKMSPPLMDRIDVHDGNINVYELWPVLVGLKRWNAMYSNSKINIVTDNMQVLAMINTGRSKNHLCMEWLREIYWLCFIHNIDLYATYIRSADNILADQLSRLKYRGYVKKCNATLSDYNMCCVSLQVTPR